MTDSKAPLDSDDVAWVTDYAKEVWDTFAAEFSAAGGRFRHGKPLLERFAKAIEQVLENDRSPFSAVDESHNELCIASALLANTDPHVDSLEYEPRLPGSSRSIDFRARARDGRIYYVDVKTIKPASKDRWEQFERAQEENWFPENVNVVLSKDWLGGEIWHSMFSARARMLEYTLEFESKIHEARLASDQTLFVIAFCGAGFHWRREDMEDFVSFYFRRRHRADDPFSQAELKYMAEKGLRFDRSINSFACMSRRQGAIRQEPITWHVRPPRDAFA